MTDLLRSTTLAVRTDPLNAPTPQTVAPWPDVLTFLHHLEALAAAGTAFQLVETPGQVAGRGGPWFGVCQASGEQRPVWDDCSRMPRFCNRR